jgi:hypothetical protein
MTKHYLHKTLASAFLVFIFFNLSAQEKQKVFIDTLDNAFDLSYYLYDLHGFLPIASPITEPAVGYGAAVAGMFFIPKEKKEGEIPRFKMPDVVGLAGGLTENKTWFAGGGYFGFWNDDRVRYRGVFGYGDINLKFYGTNNNLPQNKYIDFSIESYFFLQQVIFRIKDTHFFLGGKYQLGKSNVTLFQNSDLIKPRDQNLLNSGIGIIAEYENFDNILSPNRGLRVNITFDQFLTVLGGDRDFGRISTFMHYYHPIISSKWTGGLRIESQVATGDTPFYMLPFIYLRGVPAMRYQGEMIALIETEHQFNITRRWSLVGFGGYGRTFESLTKMESGSNAWNVGSGFRYLIARALGLKMGIDVARGPEQTAIYIVVGTSWLK